MITCPNCGENNGSNRTTCFKCHQALPRPNVIPTVNSSLLKETKSTSAPMITSLFLKVVAWCILGLSIISGFVLLITADPGNGIPLLFDAFFTGFMAFVIVGTLSSILYHLEKSKK